MAVKARFRSSKGGAGVLERPKFDQSQFDPATQLEQGGDIGRLKDKRGIGSRDSYRVLLVDDVRHTEKLGTEPEPDRSGLVRISVWMLSRTGPNRTGLHYRIRFYFFPETDPNRTVPSPTCIK
ncbi:hypothetical protein PRUPE_1G083400 [Prunus persica]|uniref:Uncharacterized protein n=2 Tax=Prunus persica TaxID=3760 RepID=A0A251QUE3_PRUPE|nr:hypothetical protein PRUPE_1G083400 [Prunus persica]